MERRIVHRTHGLSHGPIVRLMSPGDLGQVLRPFVFLDLFQFPVRGPGAGTGMPLHPHSGIATVTVFTDGEMRFDDPNTGCGTLSYGGVEWARAGRGMWHGQELSGGSSATTQGFQLWLALSPELELAASESQYLEATHIPSVGVARIIVGAYDTKTSPVRAPPGINYLLITLKQGERWTYQPPSDHSVLWLAVARGALSGAHQVSRGEMVVFERGSGHVTLEGDEATGATFVLGSAVPHAHALHLGRYSVHTSPEALAAGERHIVELKQRLDAAGDRRQASGATPVYRG